MLVAVAGSLMGALHKSAIACDHYGCLTETTTDICQDEN
jgi:hypothetical protein